VQITGLLARRRHVGVLYRRGPRKWGLLIRWNTDTDEFEEGQWFRGEIILCDLTPDGSKLLYHAIKYHWEDHEQPDKLHRWTAVSKPPYFTALVLWQNWSYGWLGGSFLNDRTLELATTIPNNLIPTQGKTRRMTVVPGNYDDGTDFYEHLMRDGWQPYPPPKRKDVPLESLRPEGWTKANKSGDMSIIRRFRNRSSLYSLRAGERGEEVPYPQADWMDWDQRGRLVYTEGGRLLAKEPDKLDAEPVLIADFTDRQFKEVVAPQWAQH
jgi:hypothetical protein